MNEYDLRNRHKDKIIDIIGKKPKNLKELVKNRNSILNLLNETNNVDEEHLENAIKLIKNNFPEEIFYVKNIDEMMNRIYQFIIYILQLDNNMLKDSGYSLLISYYFLISKNLLNNANS